MAMSRGALYGLATMPTKPPKASSRTLQWNEDGQLVVLGESMIYILTPDNGLKNSYFETSTSLVEEDSSVVKWAIATLPLQPAKCHWPEDSMAWSTVCLGALDFAWVAVTCSPTRYSKTGSCLLATLTSNAEVYLWSSPENPSVGAWSQFQDVTRDLRLYMKERTEMNAAQRVIHAQSKCLAWSPQPPSASGPDCSLLALGTCGGRVIFWRLKKETLVMVEIVDISDGWVTDLAWTNWRGSSSTVTATLACGLPRGKIVLLDIKQTYDGGEWSLHVTISTSEPYDDDGRGLTALEWIEPTKLDSSLSLQSSQLVQEDPLLVYCKTGSVHIWRAAGSYWCGLRSLWLLPVETSKGSTQFSPAAGIIYLTQYDSLIISLCDGNFHVLRDVLSSPRLSDDSDEPCSSLAISKVARAAFILAQSKDMARPRDGSEAPKIYYDHVAKTTGAVAFDSEGTFIWLHQKVFPEALVFTPDAGIRCLLVVAPFISPEAYDSRGIREIQVALAEPRRFPWEPPISRLRGSYTQLHRKGFIDRRKKDLLPLLQISAIGQEEIPEIPEPMDTELTHEWKLEVQHVLLSALCGGDLFREHLKLNLALLCLSLQPTSSEVKQIVTALEYNVQGARTAVLLKFLSKLPNFVLKDSDIAQRCLLQAQKLRLHGYETFTKLSSRVATTSIKDERCPACQVFIPFDEISQAFCSNGHYWGQSEEIHLDEEADGKQERCAATAYILATEDVKACIKCGLKMFANSEPLDDSSPLNDWLVQTILKATVNCPSCANQCIKTVSH